MPWVVSAAGKSSNVLIALQNQFAITSEGSPSEERIKQLAKALILTTVKAQIPDREISVSAAGTSYEWDTDVAPKIGNIIQINIG